MGWRGVGRIKQRAAEIDKDVKRRGGQPKHKPRAEDMADGTESFAQLLSFGHTIRDGVKALREELRKDRAPTSSSAPRDPITDPTTQGRPEEDHAMPDDPPGAVPTDAVVVTDESTAAEAEAAFAALERAYDYADQPTAESATPPAQTAPASGAAMPDTDDKRKSFTPDGIPSYHCDDPACDCEKPGRWWTPEARKGRKERRREAWSRDVEQPLKNAATAHGQEARQRWNHSKPGRAANGAVDGFMAWLLKGMGDPGVEHWKPERPASAKAIRAGADAKLADQAADRISPAPEADEQDDERPQPEQQNLDDVTDDVTPFDARPTGENPAGKWRENDGPGYGYPPISEDDRFAPTLNVTRRLNGAGFTARSFTPPVPFPKGHNTNPSPNTEES